MVAETLRDEVKGVITERLTSSRSVGIDKSVAQQLSADIADAIFKVLTIPESTQGMPRSKAMIKSTGFVVLNKVPARIK